MVLAIFLCISNLQRVGIKAIENTRKMARLSLGENIVEGVVEQRVEEVRGPRGHVMRLSVSTSRRISRLTSNRNVLSGLLFRKDESNKNTKNNENDSDSVDKYSESRLIK